MMMLPPKSAKVFYKIGVYTIIGCLVGLLVVRYSLDSGKTIGFSNSNATSHPQDLSRLSASDMAKLTQTNKLPPDEKPSPATAGAGINSHIIERNCAPKKKLIYAKTHKTGGSTVQNIFLRYGWTHNLTFALPKARTWMFNFKVPFSSALTHRYPWWNKEHKFDIFTFHSVWNYPEVRQLVPDSPAVTILRDPVDAFESGYEYMGFRKAFKMDINQYARKVSTTKAKRPVKSVYGKNQLLWDLGLNATKMDNLNDIRSKINEIDRTMDLVMIAEHMEESIILLQDLMCWNVEDVTYLDLNKRVTTAKTEMTSETRALLRQWMWADYLLYEHFVDKFKKRVAEVDNMQDRVKALRYANDQVKQRCVIVHGDNSVLSGKFKMALNIVLGYVVDEKKPGCNLYAISEPNFSFMIHERQNRRRS